MKKRIIAATLALSMLGAASTAVGAEANTPTSSVKTSTAIGAELGGGSAPATQVQGATLRVPARGAVGLRDVQRCVFRGTPTRCVIDVTRLRVSRDGERVRAFGTVSPRAFPNVAPIPFVSRVRGVDFAPGPFGEGIALQQPFPSCDILSLVLGPLHLDVLGLVIDLNRVVLDIRGQTGPGNLLGNLLCGLVGLLDDGLVLQRFLAVLTNLLRAINQLLRL